MERKTSFISFIAIGFMLFALFFGAGNLIFPAHLGQLSGDNIWYAAVGFLVTGVGLPLLGVLAIAYSGSGTLQNLAGKVHPIYGVAFTILLYLSIGPFFAAPRTGTVAYEVGIAPFFSNAVTDMGLFIFTIFYFGVTLLFSLYPARLVDNIGKILAPSLFVLLAILLTTALVQPMGEFGLAQEDYTDQSVAFINGFLEGYNTMDALASLVFGIIIIQAVNALGIVDRKEVFKATAKSGGIAIFLLAVIYVGIMYLGATSVGELGLFENGGPVLNGTAAYYFGSFGTVILAVVIILACLTTAIGLMISISEYFHTLFPNVSYKIFATIFTVATFGIANFGLENIITFSIPVLMFLYPLAIVLVILAFTSKLFRDARFVYVTTIGITFCISIFDGLQSLTDSLDIDDFTWMSPVVNVYADVLPLYSEGLGWLVPALIIIALSIAGTLGMRLAENRKE